MQGACALSRLGSLSGSLSWTNAIRQRAWSLEAEPELRGGRSVLRVLQEAGQRRAEAEYEDR